MAFGVAFIDTTWEKAVDSWPHSDLSFFIFANWLVYLVGWWIPNIVMAIVYHFDLFPSYKIQSSMKWPPAALVRKALTDNLIAHNLLHPLLSAAMYYYFFSGKQEGKVYLRELPDAFTVGKHILFAWIWADGSFYWLHRLAHHKAIYKHIHKRHHEFKTSIGLASTYAHPLEEIFVNGTSTLAWIFFVSPHPFTLWCFLLMRYQETVEEHCGYEIPFSPWALLRNNSHHDFHHSHNIGAYGTFPFWDWICGTDRPYKDWKMRQDEEKRRLKKTRVDHQNSKKSD